MKNSRIIIGGGGTGGHIFPAISIAGALMELRPDTEILFVGADSKIEMEKVPEAGYKIIGLPVAGFQRKKIWKNFSFFIRLFRSARKSARIIAEFRPDIAVGVGGYASGPILRAAAKNGIPIVIQEQNSYAGVTNRILAKKASKIFVAYDDMDTYFPPENIVFTGNPVRPDIPGSNEQRVQGQRFFDMVPGKKTVLVIGGSLGAGTINKSIEAGLDIFSDDIQLIWQTGKIYFDEINAKVEQMYKKNIMVVPFIKNMELAFGAADVIISRAGAGTISELALVGKPVILVPSPNVAEDHQTKNAMALVKKNAAIHVTDKQAETLLVKECMDLLKDEKRMEELSRNIKKMAVPDAARRIAEEIFKLL